ncbi:Na+/H+ antiporter [Nonomuraea sp. NPDC049649]|uniref:Na+/H+ antiporter n=1 Tax=Nonomuraea sp. NPDC049649 TaxID=3155776 RepID=UPI0034236F18
MTLFGVGLALVPFVPDMPIEPGLVLPLLLPPLLYSAVQRTSWRQFAADWQPILMLAVVLVFVTTMAVAVVAHAIVPGLPLAAAVALGALVSPPDPAAATSVAGRLGLPQRLVSLLEGEGLFNDTTAIVLYNVAIAAMVTGSFSLTSAVGEFVLAAAVAVVVGLGVGWLGGALRAYLGQARLQVALSLLIPYISYAVAQQLHGSGVLAVLTTAFYLDERVTDPDDVSGRLVASAFWQVVETLVTAVAFGLIGLQLRALFGIAGQLGEVLVWSAAVLGVLSAVRLLWLLPATWLARKTHGGRPGGAMVTLGRRETVVMWWSGMRGVLSVALALAIPLETADGSPFPQRPVLVFIGFTVILTTLVVQGLTLPWLVSRLGVKAGTAAERELEKRLAAEAVSAAKRRLKEIDEMEELPADVLDAANRRMADLGRRISPEGAHEERRAAYAKRAERSELVRRVQAEMMSAARQAVLDARRDPAANPQVVSRVLNQLDVRSLR